MSLKSFVNTPNHWKSFVDRIEQEIERTHKKLENSKTMDDTFRLQGRIHAYRNLLTLRDEMNAKEKVDQ